MAIRRAERFRRLALGFALAPLFTAGVVFVNGDVVLARQVCVTRFEPPVLNVSAAGGSDPINPPPTVRVLTATSTCQWSFSNPPIPSWIGFVIPLAAAGPFVVSFGGIQPNMDMSPRSAILMFDGRPLTVTQAGNPCPLTVSTNGIVMPVNGGQASFTINTPGASCAYSVGASAGVTIVSGGRVRSHLPRRSLPAFPPRCQSHSGPTHRSITASPTGVLDVPLQNATGLSGAVPIGGWALDDVGIRRVQIYRSPMPLEFHGEIYLGDATRVRGARPDVGRFYTAPETTQAGWGSRADARMRFDRRRLNGWKSRLDTWWWWSSCGTYEAHLLKGDVAGPLPPGASINGETGVFSWLPPVEFSGTFEFVFVRRACSGREERIPLRVVIEPR
jgi:hypothetical protein